MEKYSSGMKFFHYFCGVNSCFYGREDFIAKGINYMKNMN